MFSRARRSFLQTASTAGLAISADRVLRPLTSAQALAAGDQVKIYIDARRTLNPLDRNLFGSFLEHLGRAIYEGIYDPSSKLSDGDGFRKDVIDEVRNLNVPIVRYPGGNFVSGYHWLDGVGPKQDRPRVLDKAWNSIDTNQFGTNEFLAWAKLVGTQPLLAVNLGTGTPEMAAALVEYCNVVSGTQWSELRRKHGIEQPYNVRAWCLGNEMDGPWQIGHMSATEYGLKAADASRQMRYVDPGLKLVACGSSGPTRPSYLEWDREVLEQCFDYVDAISLHRYFDNTDETGGDSSKFLALNLSMERQIEEVSAVCDFVQGLKRSSKKLWLSFDEWNIWYRARKGAAMDGNRTSAPHLLEEIYNLEDALLVGGLINSLIRNSERVRVGCLAQLVNVIAPLMTNSNGLLRQTIFYPYSWALQFARGSALNVLIENSTTYSVAGIDRVPHLDVAGTFNSVDGSITVFILNRDLSKPRQFEINWEDRSPGPLLTSLVLTGGDLKAVNSFDAPQRVGSQAADKPSSDGSRTRVEVPPRSYSVFRWGT